MKNNKETKKGFELPEDFELEEISIDELEFERSLKPFLENEEEFEYWLPPGKPLRFE